MGRLSEVVAGGGAEALDGGVEAGEDVALSFEAGEHGAFAGEVGRGKCDAGASSACGRALPLGTRGQEVGFELAGGIAVIAGELEGLEV